MSESHLKSSNQNSRNLINFVWLLKLWAFFIDALQACWERVLSIGKTKKIEEKRWDVVQHFIPSRSGDAYSFTQPLPVGRDSAAASLLSEIFETYAFRRLETVRFLGGIDYVLIRSPNGSSRNVRYTRLQHSLGVGRLAIEYATHVGLSRDDARTIFVAALLHDIGHAPFSHSLEPLFKEQFGISHHAATADLICGRVDVGRELYRVLKENEIDVESVLSLVSGEEESFHGLFSGPINLDTMEGISRSKRYAFHSAIQVNPSSVLRSAVFRTTSADRDVVDEFWNQKNEAYKYIINSRIGILADYACQHFARQHLNKLSPQDYFVSEEVMFRKLPGLNALLTHPDFENRVWNLADQTIPYRVRTFFVDAKSDFFARDDLGRYKQVRDDHVLARQVVNTDQIYMAGDLFDGNALCSSEESIRRRPV